jgi:hypothetical protein
MAWRLAMLAAAGLAATGMGAQAQVAAVAPDTIYESPRPVYATPPAIYGTPEITLAPTAPMAIGEATYTVPASRVARPKAFVTPAIYGDVVSHGSYPFLVPHRCVTDLGYGRWEPCD